MYLYDPNNQIEQNLNKEMVLVESLESSDEDLLHAMIVNHHEYTGSHTAMKMINNWKESVANFIKLIPSEYKEVLRKRSLAIDHHLVLVPVEKIKKHG